MNARTPLIYEAGRVLRPVPPSPLSYHLHLTHPQEQRAQQAGAQQPYKGYYNPNGGGQLAQAAQNANAAYNAGGARGGVYQPPGGRLQPLGNAQKQVRY
jgi:hypothetical protein